MKALNIIKYIFAIVGATMLVVAIAMYLNTASFLERAVTTEGLVVELIQSSSNDSTTYYPVIRFNDHSNRQVEFKSSYGADPPSYHRGEQMSVIYEPSKPQDAKINSFFSLWGGALIVGVLGLVFGAIGGGRLLFDMVKRRSNARLKQYGVEVPAQFQGVELNTALTVNGRNPFRIVCQWQHPQTSELYVFRSEDLWFDPSDHIEGDTVPVLVDETNLKKYWVDTSFLPKLAS